MIFPLAPERIMRMPVKTVVHALSSWNPGSANEFYSEADYWWKNPQDPQGAYICRDGMSNPECFNRHRKLVLRMSCQIAGLTSAYLEDNKTQYLQTVNHILHAWFIDSNTAMRPHLNYAQAIRNKCSGRCFGVIDTIHLAETALSIKKLADVLPADTVKLCKKWFADFLEWLCTSELGNTERCTTNNHSVCWYMQASAYASLTGNEKLLAEFRNDFKNILLQQIAPDGSCPLELERTKPYGYSLFVLEAFTGLAAILSTSQENFFTVKGDCGQNVAKAMEYIVPFIADKSLWQLPPDVLYDEYWPCRMSSLCLSGHFLQKSEYRKLYEQLPFPAAVFEVLRNFPIRHPRLWM